MKNIIDSIITLVKQNEINLKSNQNGNNRVNIVGYALEDYVKNLFADSFNCSETEKLQKWSDVFSYLGNNSNPPDIMLKNGDAIEVKKIESDDSAIALNSSYPKHTLLRTNPMISNACRESENWTEKDMIYAVGVVKNNKLKHLCMIYGRNYCASDECYEEYKKTKIIDPLQITHFKPNGTWYIENPWTVFNYVYERDINTNFNFMCLIDDFKWNQLNNVNELLKIQSDYTNLKISNVKIKNPDNPVVLESAKLITYCIEAL